MNVNRSLTFITKITINKIPNRTMFKFAAHQGINIRLVRPILHNAIDNRGYAAVGAKTKIPKEYDTFDKDTKQNLIANHFQLITDFNLIYEDPKEIRLYQIGTLFTRSNKTSSTLLAQTENFRGENKRQELQFLHQAIPVITTIFKVKDSEKYFNKPEIKHKIEDHTAYKNLFDTVMNELKQKNIQVREATSSEEALTGYHVLLKGKLNEKNAFEDLPL